MLKENLNVFVRMRLKKSVCIELHNKLLNMLTLNDT